MLRDLFLADGKQPTDERLNKADWVFQMQQFDIHLVQADLDQEFIDADVNGDDLLDLAEYKNSITNSKSKLHQNMAFYHADTVVDSVKAKVYGKKHNKWPIDTRKDHHLDKLEFVEYLKALGRDVTDNVALFD